jgi:monothiol glutaredoxin
MSLSADTRARIESILTSHEVVLFMKGSPQRPQCGFSMKASGIIGGIVAEYAHVDVLQDPEIREGIKVYGQWPTIPQLYFKGELIGGSDIIEQMMNSGELHALLGGAVPDRTPPTISITDEAAAQIRKAMADQGEGLALHMAVDAKFNSRFELKPATGQEISATANGITVHFDLASAPRANGIAIDWVDNGVRGAGLSITNPNAPAQVRPLSVKDLAARLAEFTVVDVRPPQARALASFPASHAVLDETTHDDLAALPKDTKLAFLCHHGNSSRQAAEHFRGLGFTQVYNVEGGIDAWSTDVDASVPRY